MSKPRQTRLPNPLRNPVTLVDIAEELFIHVENIKKEAAEKGRVEREKPRVLRITNYARELKKYGEAKIGDQLNDA